MAESIRASSERVHTPGTSGSPRRNGDWGKVEMLLKDLPPGIPILPLEDGCNFEEYTHLPPRSYTEGDGWKNCARSLEKYDSDLCKGYREEIDTLLVFAGLFSAVVTAFVIESYQWLQGDSNDAIVLLLTQIAQSMSPNTTTISPIRASTGLPGPVSLRINIYWFLALALSLATALVAILCKQWIREFERNMGLTPKQFIGIHHTKLEGLEKWRVGGIISLLPLLLQLALALFSLGGLELLWQLHSAVAAVVCVPTIVVFLFYVATTVLPVLQYQRLNVADRLTAWQTLSECPYKSPQANLAFRVHHLCLWISAIFTGALAYVGYLLSTAHYHMATRLSFCRQVSVPRYTRDYRRLRFDAPSWYDASREINYRLDRAYALAEDALPKSLYRSLRWIDWNVNDGDLTEWVWRCLWETAVGHDESDSSSRRRGLYHVCSGSIAAPQIGSLALAIGYLAWGHAPYMFVVEAVCQNLMGMDPASAEYLFEQLIRRPSPHQESQTYTTILRVAAAYARLYAHEHIGQVLVSVTVFVISCSDPQLCGALSDCALSLYLTWIQAKRLPHDPATAASTTEILRIHCNALLDDAEQYSEHPERLRRRPHIRQLAELLRAYAGMPARRRRPPPSDAYDDRACALASEINDYVLQELTPIIRELLDMPPDADDAVTPARSESPVGDGARRPRSRSPSAQHAPADGACGRSSPRESGELASDEARSAGSAASQAHGCHAPEQQRLVSAETLGASHSQEGT